MAFRTPIGAFESYSKFLLITMVRRFSMVVVRVKADSLKRIIDEIG